MTDLITIDRDNFIYKNIQVTYDRMRKRFFPIGMHYSTESISEMLDFIDLHESSGYVSNKKMKADEVKLYVSDYPLVDKEFIVKIDNEWQYIVSKTIPENNLYLKLDYDVNYAYHSLTDKDRLFCAYNIGDIDDLYLNNIVWSREDEN